MRRCSSRLLISPVHRLRFLDLFFLQTSARTLESKVALSELGGERKGGEGRRRVVGAALPRRALRVADAGPSSLCGCNLRRRCYFLLRRPFATCCFWKLIGLRRSRVVVVAGTLELGGNDHLYCMRLWQRAACIGKCWHIMALLLITLDSGSFVVGKCGDDCSEMYFRCAALHVMSSWRNPQAMFRSDHRLMLMTRLG